MPFANGRRRLERCVESLLDQDLDPARYELILVDNGSTDGSAEVARSTPRVELVVETTPGPYAARNAGARHAKGRLLAFTDADCRPAAPWLATLAAAVDGGAEIVLGGYAAARPTRSLVALAAYENEKNRLILSGRRRDRYYGYANNMAVTREVFARFGPFPEAERGGDAVLVRRYVDECGVARVRFAAEATVVHAEIDSVAAYLGKVFVHARSIQRLSAAHRPSPLGARGRVGAWRRAGAGYGAGGRLVLSLVLLAGLGCWVAGRLVGVARPIASS